MTTMGASLDTPSDVHVELVGLPPAQELGREWRDLEDRSNGSFYLGWSWIGCWIDSLAGAVELQLLRATRGGRTVGLCIFAPGRERRHGLIASRTLHLHATGRGQFDILTVECNGFLLERGSEDGLCQRMLDYLLEEQRGWDELVFIRLRDDMGSCLAGSKDLRLRTRTEANYYVDLAAVRANADDYLGLLGTNTRSQIRRSAKEYSKSGELSLVVAEDAAQASVFLDGLKELHQKYWVARGQPGAFSSRFFEDFHRRLLQQAFARGEIQVLAIDAGAQRLGYLYNFVHRGRVYNYQSGFNYEICEKHNRPGLVAHAKAIEFNASAGHAVYDFLAGDVQYKKTMGTVAGEMTWLTVQRKRLRFLAEDWARQLYKRWR
jgi:CelD/BcsL family acetyltransferase involved in cellulose biosynthesis